MDIQMSLIEFFMLLEVALVKHHGLSILVKIFLQVIFKILPLVWNCYNFFGPYTIGYLYSQCGHYVICIRFCDTTFIIKKKTSNNVETWGLLWEHGFSITWVYGIQRLFIDHTSVNHSLRSTTTTKTNIKLDVYCSSWLTNWMWQWSRVLGLHV